jgi:hypothetical protein
VIRCVGLDILLLRALAPAGMCSQSCCLAVGLYVTIYLCQFVPFDSCDIFYYQLIVVMIRILSKLVTSYARNLFGVGEPNSTSSFITRDVILTDEKEET